MFLLVFFACAPDDPDATDDTDADTDTDADADSDSDTDADTLPDCGAYSGVGAPGRSWSFDIRNYDGLVWTLNQTITSVDVATGQIELSFSGLIDYTNPSQDAYDTTQTGTISWLCDATGLQLVASSIHSDSPSGSSDDVWAYDPPTILVPYDPGVAVEWTVAGVHNGVAFATTGSSGPIPNDSVTTTAGEFPAVNYLVYSGTRELYRAASAEMGLIYEQDASSMPYPVQSLTEFTP